MKSRYPFSGCALIGYSFGQGAPIAGTEQAPRVLRALHIAEKIRALGIAVTDFGDVTALEKTADESSLLSQVSEDESKAKNVVAVYQACKQLEAKVQKSLDSNLMPLILGGDHSLSIGNVAGVANFFAKKKKSIGLIWIDTHADINTPTTSPSRMIHGMSVAVLSGRVPGLLQSLQQTSPAIKAKNLAYVGLRSVDPGEQVILRGTDAAVFSIKEVDTQGLGSVMAQAIAAASKNTAGFVVSFDLDVCDPRLVPGTGTPFRGGLTLREAHLVMELLYDSGKTLSLEMVEFNPTLDTSFRTADLATSLIESALGKAIS